MGLGEEHDLSDWRITENEIDGYII